MPDRTASPTGPGAWGGYHIVADPSVFASTAAAFLGRKLTSLVERGSGSIALSGGSTPGPVYEALARDPDIDWGEIDIFFADERIVPLDDSRSNYRLARETLFEPARIPPERVHPMPVESSDPAAPSRYGRRLPERLDLLILGIGRDGHTASLFPGSAALWAEERVVRTTAPVEPFERMTITPSVIATARLVVVLARGPEKAEAVGRAMDRTTEVGECPARLVGRGIWILGSDTVEKLRGETAATL